MKNALIYNYNINVDKINNIKDNYYFNYQGYDFIISLYDRSVEEAVHIYDLNVEMLNMGFPAYKIILTKDNNVLFYYESNYYVLMQYPLIENRKIGYEDILNFNFLPSSRIIKALDKSNWSYYWENKIDFFEYQFQQIENKYPILRESINFYIGIWENAISYYNDNFVYDNNGKFLAHKRVSYNTDLYEFYNPLNLVVDHKERDIAEYIKSYIYNENFTEGLIKKFLVSFKNDRNKSIVLVSRLLFPSSYFDLYEDIILEKKQEEEIYNIINKKDNYLELLRIVFRYFSDLNIPIIEWIIKEP